MEHVEHGHRVHRVLASESRAALLEELRRAGRPLSAPEAAKAVGLHPSTTRMHLDMLVSAGLVDRAAERRATVGRPVIRYTVRPLDRPSGIDASRMGEAAGDEYRQLAGLLADGLARSPDPVGAAREAGRRWTQAMDVSLATPAEPDDAIDQVVALMDRLGFSPERPEGEDRLELHRCPFEAIAREHRGVVCGVHQGMLDETFVRLGDSVTVEGLEPFVSEHPLRCVVDLQRTHLTSPDAARSTSRGDDEARGRRAQPAPGRRSRGDTDG